MLVVRPIYSQPAGGRVVGAPLELSRVPGMGELVQLEGITWRVDAVTHTPGGECVADVQLARCEIIETRGRRDLGHA